MPAFDPNIPVDNSEAEAVEMRNQFNALKALNDAQAAQITALTARVQALETALAAKPSMDQVNAAIVANSAANCDDVTYLQLDPNDPPTKSDAQAIIERMNQLITTTHR